MPSPGLLIRIGITTKTRAMSERYRHTKTATESWFVETTLDSYTTDLTNALPGIWAYVTQQRALGAEVTAHYSARLENVTAAAPPKGAWVQAKQHYDGALTSDELSAQTVFTEKLDEAVAAMRELAKY